jgi:hypothetical protein
MIAEAHGYAVREKEQVIGEDNSNRIRRTRPIDAVRAYVDDIAHRAMVVAGGREFES